MPTASEVVEIEAPERLTVLMEQVAHEEGATLSEYIERLALAYLVLRTTLFQKVEVLAPA